MTEQLTATPFERARQLHRQFTRKMPRAKSADITALIRETLYAEFKDEYSPQTYSKASLNAHQEPRKRGAKPKPKVDTDKLVRAAKRLLDAWGDDRVSPLALTVLFDKLRAALPQEKR